MQEIKERYQIFSKEEIVNNISNRYLPLSDEAKREFVAETTMHCLPKDSYVVQEGDRANGAFFIAGGCVKSCYSKNQREVVDWFGFENEFLNSFYSFFLNEPSRHYIKTLEPTILLEIPQEAISRVGRKHVQLLKLQNFVHAFVVTFLQKKMRSIHFESSIMRYESLTAFRPFVFQRVPIKDIASYLGMSIENLSRIRAQLVKK